MTTAELTAAVCGLASGECRWIGREDVHVYCRAPMIEELQPSGRIGWQPGPATYSVVCPDAGMKAGTWVTAGDAVRMIQAALAKEVAA